MTIQELTAQLCAQIAALSLADKVNALNETRAALHAISPFQNEPVDFVKWVPALDVEGNEYNPNKVARPEMVLLELSILEDGYTQPIVSYPLSKAIRRLQVEGKSDEEIMQMLQIDAEKLTRFASADDRREVTDGFHRNRVGKESAKVNKRIHGYLPVTAIRPDRENIANRRAATIRHNRARGEHETERMAELVSLLTKDGLTNAEIAKALGMEPEEVLRLKQVKGVAEMLANRHYDRAWMVVVDSEVDVAES